ncbi:hypothetical protein DL765_004616 [Monosporascus sp. GIB2]|nr:hypothetical protein DL765_004616 [Monosporascus sp. GIB2]
MAADTLSLSGKTALITGSGRENGIGAAIARAFARNGAAVAIHYVSEQSKARADKVAADITREFGVKTTVVQGSVDNQDSTKNIVEKTLKGLGVDHIDILVNNGSAVVPNQALLEATPERLQYEFGINVFGTIYMTQAVVREGKMPRGGRIINIGSIASKTTPMGTSIYNASKSAQDSLTASWAGELGRSYGITVNTLAPGPIPTDMSKPYLQLPDGSPNPSFSGYTEMVRADNRFGTVEDMADAALLLVSEKSRWITAQWISVSGGITGTIWPADPSLDACIRCNKRGARCEYDTAVRWHGMPRQVNSPSTSVAATLDGGQDLDIQGTNTTSILTQELTHTKNLQVSTPTQVSQEISIAAPLGPLLDGNWEADQREISSLGFENMQKGILPPFISPRLYSLAETARGPSQQEWASANRSVNKQALINSVGLVNMFKSRTKADKSLIWGRIWFELERISAAFDRWELLAALQALLIYCLLRLQDTPVGHEIFDVSLLTTVNPANNQKLVSTALATAVALRCDYELPKDPKSAWREWVFSESRRRTVLIFQIINMLVDIPTTISYYSIWGLIFVPLPGPAPMWNALDLDGWTTGFKQWYEERTLYGLSEAGALMRLKKETDGVCQTGIAEWEDWAAEIGDIGTLVMIVAPLLSAGPELVDGEFRYIH